MSEDDYFFVIYVILTVGLCWSLADWAISTLGGF